MTALELAEAIRQGELSPVEITDHYLDRIDRLNEQTGAFYTVTADLAKEQAKAAEEAAADHRRAGGDASELPPLTAVPIPLTPLNMIAGGRATFGSSVLPDNVAADDDFPVADWRT